MKSWPSYFYHIFIFIMAQLAWLILVSLWIYWYVSNYIIFNRVDDKLSPQVIPEGRNVFVLVSGLVLMVAISMGMSMLFRRLSAQYQLTKLYDNFIANVTHELKSPLASIRLYLETLQQRDVPPVKQQEFVRLMLRDSDRLNSLINAILDIPILENKKIAHHFLVIEAEGLLRNLIKEAEEQFQLPPDAITIKGEAAVPCVVDVNSLRIVVCNLIDNGIKYCGRPLRMTVTLSQNGKNMTASFRDEGIGIPKEEWQNIFKKFYRIYDNDSPSVKGTGLGLYWINEIIKYHGGTVTVYSDGKFQGTTFHINLPIYRASKHRYIEKLIELTQRNQHRKTWRDKIN